MISCACCKRYTLSCLQGILQKASGCCLSLGTSSSFCRACKELADPADIFFPSNIVYLQKCPLCPLTADTGVLKDTLLFCWVVLLPFRCFMFDSSIGCGKVLYSVTCSKQTHLGYPGSSWEKVVLLGRYFCSPAKVHTSVTHSATFVLLTGRQTHRSDVTHPASFTNTLRHIISLVRCPPPVPSRKFYKLSPHITTHGTWKHRDTESKKNKKQHFVGLVCALLTLTSHALYNESC